MKAWSCKVGFVGAVPANADKDLAVQGMNRFVRRKFKEFFGKQPDFAFIDVNDQLTETERHVAKVGDEAVVVFHCKIGVKGDLDLPNGADLPIRMATESMFSILFRKDAEFNFSGWNASLTEAELATI
jgi:hypothetical protein